MVLETIEEIKTAVKKATLAEDRAAVRNLGVGYKLMEMEHLLRDVKMHEEYITQPKFKKYFE